MKGKRDDPCLAFVHWRDFRRRIFLEGIIVGVVAGLVTVAFRYCLERGDAIRNSIYLLIQARGVGIALGWFVLLLMIGLLISALVKIEPLARGSGIPDVKAILAGHYQMNWLRVLLVKFVGGVLAIGAGLSLGREGPSVQLGAAAGQGISRFFGRKNLEENYLLTSGASAGLAAAFNAPLAGVIFALEELHKNFSPQVLMSAMAASLTAAFVTQQAFGTRPVFDFPALEVFPLRYYLYLLVLGVICGAFGTIFNKALLGALNAYEKLKRLPTALIPLIPLMIGGLLGFVLPQVLGGGNSLIQAISRGNFTVTMLLILVAAKFMFTMLSYGSGVPGGIFLPLLVIGALTGDIYGQVVIHYFHVDNLYALNFIALAMAAYFTAIVKAPVTGSILITEMTGSFQNLLAIATVAMTAYIVSDLLNGKPVYEELLARGLARRKQCTSRQPGNKVITEMEVCLGSRLVNRCIKEIAWPENCLLISIKRGCSEIIPQGETTILAGDYLYVLANEVQTAQIKHEIELLARTVNDLN